MSVTCEREIPVPHFTNKLQRLREMPEIVQRVVAVPGYVLISSSLCPELGGGRERKEGRERVV